MVITHTPGPWNVDESGIEIVNSKGERIAEVSVEATDSLEELEANAQLLAAAPDLLASLKETREVAAALFRVVVGQTGMLDKVLAELPPGLRKRSEGFGARAGDAIDKAEGRS